MMTPAEEVESLLGLRDFDFEVLLGSSRSRLVVTGNPLVNSAAMCNDARGSGREPNAELFVALFVCMDGSRELHVMLQTTEQIKAGCEILVDYGAAFWDAWAKHKDAMDNARGEALAGLLTALGCLGGFETMSGHRVPHVGEKWPDGRFFKLRIQSPKCAASSDFCWSSTGSVNKSAPV
jgi:hypothetical protein